MKPTKINISKRRKTKSISFVVYGNRYLYAINTVGRYFIKEYDQTNYPIYSKYSDGYWEKMKYIDGYMVYRETSKSGVVVDRRLFSVENKMRNYYLNRFGSIWQI